MRKFALGILDIEDNVIDRYNLDFVTEPSGLGFSLTMSSIETDIEDLITQIVQAKNKIKFSVNQIYNSYTKSQTLTQFIQKYSKIEYRMVLIYEAGGLTKYCEGRVTSLTKSEINEFKNLVQTLEFTQTTPFFIKRENTLTIKLAAVGKSYPYKYPYSYGINIVANNDIENPYILDIPIIIRINGAINNPTISLANKETGIVYNTVKFDNFFLNEGEQIIINSAQAKIFKIDADGNQIDFIPEVDPANDTFLRAVSGNSIIIVNSADAESSFELKGGWREYTL